MFKNLLWKFFPPRQITDMEIEGAYNAFENMRKNRYQFNSVYPSDLHSAFLVYERLIVKRKEYLEYEKRKKV